MKRSIDVGVSEMSDVKIEKYSRGDVEGEGVRESEKVSEASSEELRSMIYHTYPTKIDNPIV